MSNVSLISLSGGVESSTIAFLKNKEKVVLQGIYIETKKSQGALAAAQWVADEIGFHLEKVDNTGFAALANKIQSPKFISETDYDSISLLKRPEFSQPGQYAASGHTQSLAIAMFYAQTLGIKNIVIGIEKDQAKKIPNFLEYLRGLEKISSFTGNSPVSFETPFIDLSKAEVIQLAKSLDLPVERFWSCYGDLDAHCGTDCNGCKNRRAAFEKAGILDRTIYVNTNSVVMA
jgi:7-cyano-7-deazaguanine synthase